MNSAPPAGSSATIWRISSTGSAPAKNGTSSSARGRFLGSLRSKQREDFRISLRALDRTVHDPDEVEARVLDVALRRLDDLRYQFLGENPLLQQRRLRLVVGLDQ